jgi:putative heme-binding domain-containing protein
MEAASSVSDSGNDMMFGMVRFLLFCALAARAQRLPQDFASIDAGRQLYLGSCSGCHGATGEGSQGPSLLSGRVARMQPQALMNTIKNGLPGTTMPNFPLEAADLRRLAAFLRTLTSPAVHAPVPGDAAKGRELFFGAAKCSGCHMIGGKGGHPGPDLSNIGAERTLPQLRESVLKPSQRIAPGFQSAVAALKNGKTIRGVAKNHSNYDAQILDNRGQLHLLSAPEIRTLELPGQSLMPPLENPSQANDLISFLARQSTRPTEGAQP